MEDDDIRTLVSRLARPHPSGGQVIERAAILAEGAESGEVLRWILAHGGEPEELAPVTSGGLHGTRFQDRSGVDSRRPLRYILPPDALS